MRKYHKITPEGINDMLFEQCAKQAEIVSKLSRLYNRMGYSEVQTPALEYYDVFNRSAFGIMDECMYKVIDSQGRIMVLRPDNTIPIARLFSTRLQSAESPIRLYYNQQVYNIAKSMRGQKNAVMQSGVELIGAGGKRADLEVIFTAIEAVENIVPDYRLELGHAGFFKALAAKIPVTDELREDIRLSIESKNYAALSAIIDRLAPTPETRLLKRLPRLFGGEEVFDEAEKLCTDQTIRAPLNYLREIYHELVKHGFANKIIVDLGTVHRNDYYNGIIFSGYIPGTGDKVISGGRYDSLIESFGEKTPATGFAINVDEFVKAALAGLDKCSKPLPDCLIHADDGYEFSALLYSKELIKKNDGHIRIEYSDFKNREEAMAYAKRLGISSILFVNENIEKIEI